jgi:hypothetical protein
MVLIDKKTMPLKVTGAITLIDFSKPLKQTKLVSDATERLAGRSSGAISLQKNKRQRLTVFFACLVPQPNGAAFVSFLQPIKPALKSNGTLLLEIQNMAPQYTSYQFIVRTKYSQKHGYSYRANFTVRPHQAGTIRIPVRALQASFRGRTQLPAFVKPLITSQITEMGPRITESIGNKHRQSGCYALGLKRLLVT